jgi:hypothetical protein
MYQDPPPDSRSEGSAGAPSGSSIIDVVARVEPSVVTIRTVDGLGSGVIYKLDGVWRPAPSPTRTSASC